MDFLVKKFNFDYKPEVVPSPSLKNLSTVITTVAPNLQKLTRTFEILSFVLRVRTVVILLTFPH